MAEGEFIFEDSATIEATFIMDVTEADHNALFNRDIPNQHPISAITGLQDALDTTSNAIATERERAEGVEGSLSNLTTENKTNLVSAINEVDSHADTNATNLSNHIADKNNPHDVTKVQVGLGNVDNTSDLDKPISTATQTALNGKQNNLSQEQLNAVNSGINSTLVGQISTNQTDISTINGKIPSDASSSNQLADKSYVDTALGGKQNTISDLPTIRSNATAGKSASDTIATYGNIVTHNTSEFATSAQGALADTAVQPSDLAEVATSGDYDDLVNKPTIPAAQVNSDWNANSGVAEILNKPTLGTMAAESASDYTKTSGLATVATSGNYNDLSNKPTIPTVTDTYSATSSDGMSGKAVASAISGKANDSDVVKLTGDQTIYNTKTFSTATGLQAKTPVILKQDSSLEGGEIRFQGADNEPNASKTLYIDRYNGKLRMVGYDSNDTTYVGLELDFENATTKTLTPTEDTTNSTQIDTVGARNTKLQGYADNSLSNLSSDGQMVIDSQNGTISNCILEIPQNLKLEISGNNVIAKAGTIIVDAGSTYTTVTYTQDTTYTKTWIANKRYVIFGSKAGTLYGVTIDECSSGNGSSIPSTGVYFNTSDKNFYIAGTYNQWIAYPVCLIDIDESGNIKGFAKDSNGNDMIFNGWCYIGGSNNETCSFIIYPNIKGLSPNGINSNGNLDSVNLSRSALTIVNRTGLHDDLSVALSISNTLDIVIFDDIEYDNLSDITNPVDYTIYYIKSENRYYRYVSGNYTVWNNLPFIVFDKKSTGVTIKQVRQPYEGARNLLTDELQADVKTLTGYDSTQTQTLKNINGVLTWVTD